MKNKRAALIVIIILALLGLAYYILYDVLNIGGNGQIACIGQYFYYQNIITMQVRPSDGWCGPQPSWLYRPYTKPVIQK